MNTLHFKYAVEVEKTGSITQAAENLFMGQPNLSKAIMELEDTLGFRIFKRTSKGVIPTDKGAAFLGYAKGILASIEKMEALSDENTRGQSLSFCYPRCNYITSAIRKFASSLDYDGKIRLNIRETNSVQVINGVSSGIFNFGIVRYKMLHEPYFADYIRDKELEVMPFWEFNNVVLTANGNYKDVKKVTIQDLYDLTPVSYGDETIPYLSFGEVRRDAKSPAASKAIFVYDRGTALALLTDVPSTFMLAAPSTAADTQMHSLYQVKCDFPNERTKDIIVYQKGYRFSESDRKFIDILSKIKNEIEFDLQ